MSLWLLVGLGGFIGAVLRHLISGWIQCVFVTFPVGTLSLNFLGSLVLSIIIYASQYRGFLGEEARIFLAVGVLGSFTTMSTFSLESMKLLEQSEHIMFGLNIIGTISLCLLAINLGKVLVLAMGMK